MSNWTEQEIQAVWNKGHPVKGYNPAEYRQDDCTAWMQYDKHGDRNSIFGWEVDHIDPVGGDHFSNLRPLQWENNVAKSDGSTECVVKSNGNKNVR